MVASIEASPLVSSSPTNSSRNSRRRLLGVRDEVAAGGHVGAADDRPGGVVVEVAAAQALGVGPVGVDERPVRPEVGVLLAGPAVLDAAAGGAGTGLEARQDTLLQRLEGVDG